MEIKQNALVFARHCVFGVENRSLTNMDRIPNTKFDAQLAWIMLRVPTQINYIKEALYYNSG